ncbi:hypothetical protein [Nocardia sp. MW-W600-9]
MTDQHSRVRAPGIARVLAVLMLLAGIVAMHSAVFGTAHAHSGAPESPALPAGFAARSVSAETVHAEPAPGNSAAPNAMTASLPSDGLLAATHITSSGHDHLAGALALPGPLADADIAGSGDAAAHLALPHEDKHAMGAGCGASGCDERVGIHGCVFVLAALAAALTLVLLYRLTDDAAAGGAAATRPWRGRRERPPPWTVLSLSQLAILRI